MCLKVSLCVRRNESKLWNCDIYVPFLLSVCWIAGMGKVSWTSGTIQVALGSWWATFDPWETASITSWVPNYSTNSGQFLKPFCTNYKTWLSQAGAIKTRLLQMSNVWLSNQLYNNFEGLVCQLAVFAGHRPQGSLFSDIFSICRRNRHCWSCRVECLTG